MDTRTNVVKGIIFAVIAIILGLIGFSLFFSDLGSQESEVNRIVIIVLFFFVSGLVIGYFNPRIWMLAGLTAWLCVLFGGGVLLRGATKQGDLGKRQTFRIVITEEKVELASTMLNVGKLYIEQVNEGVEVHELCFFTITGDSEIERLERGEFQNLTLSGCIKPLKPGESSVSIFADIFEPGRYVVACSRQTAESVPHVTLGEIAEFTVQ